MTLIYNKTIFRERRRDLRRNQTEAEKILWSRLRNKRCLGLKFFRQYSVGAYIMDFYCPEYKLAIELDGGQHAEDESKEYDRIRTDYLKSKGIEVVRFWNNEVLNNTDGVFEEITKKLTFQRERL
ncbi:MAG: endonuclease domain-containing protein [Nitrospiraceae bacterium]|nr:endonuclease domain-containing protein [Nitrospiraceae bacterium]